MSKEKSKEQQRHDLLALQTEIQRVLDELWEEKLLPFALRLGKLDEGAGSLTLHFYDSRIRSANVVIDDSASLAGLVRAAVMARVKEMSGPLSPKNVHWLDDQ